MAEEGAEKVIDIVDEFTDINIVDDNQYNNIRSFLQKFFADWKSENITTDILKCCKSIIKNNKLSSININTWNLTAFTFERSLRQVCKELFRYTYKVEYVISLLSFAIELDKHLEDKTWYETKWLINVLTMELVKTPFNPDNIYVEDNNKSFLMFLSIILLVALTYILYV